MTISNRHSSPTTNRNIKYQKGWGSILWYSSCLECLGPRVHSQPQEKATNSSSSEPATIWKCRLNP